MNITIYPRILSGEITAIPSKSQAHRLLICSAFADRPTDLICPETNQDIEATVDCLKALGAVITHTERGYQVIPAKSIPSKATLNCRESGSTLRFMLPVVGALGVEGHFLLSGRLPQRPLSPLWEEMERMGCMLTRPTADTITCKGQLKPGNYTIDGGVSSQYITGLLFAMALMNGKSKLTVTGKLESGPYVEMTRKALSAFGVSTDHLCANGSRPFTSPGSLTVEGDWSNGAFFIAANAMGNPITVKNLDPASPQGDRAIDELSATLQNHCTINAADIPDLVPILSVLAAVNNGADFTNIRRLRLKESDRVEAVISMLSSLGIQAKASEDTLTVYPGRFAGGIVDSVNDHRIAMAAAIAATVASGPVTITDAHCVAKSYPTFWDEYGKLGGHYEQYIR